MKTFSQVTTVFTPAVCHRKMKTGQADTELNTLLNIYKMNPLKRSKVYEKFSKQLLSFTPDTKRPVLNIDLNESGRQKEKKTSTKFRHIESIVRNSQEYTTDFNPFHENTPENIQSSLIDDILKMEHYNIDDKIAEEEIKLLVDNVDGKLISGTVLNDISSEQQKQPNGESIFSKGNFKRAEESSYNNVVVLR